jgi:hypothetical protein
MCQGPRADYIHARGIENVLGVASYSCRERDAVSYYWAFTALKRWSDSFLRHVDELLKEKV